MHRHERFTNRQTCPQRPHGLPGLAAEVVEGLVDAFPAVPRPVFRLSAVTCYLLAPDRRSWAIPVFPVSAEILRV